MQQNGLIDGQHLNYGPHCSKVITVNEIDGKEHLRKQSFSLYSYETGGRVAAHLFRGLQRSGELSGDGSRWRCLLFDGMLQSLYQSQHHRISLMMAVRVLLEVLLSEWSRIEEFFVQRRLWFNPSSQLSRIEGSDDDWVRQVLWGVLLPELNDYDDCRFLVDVIQCWMSDLFQGSATDIRAVRDRCSHLLTYLPSLFIVLEEDDIRDGSLRKPGIILPTTDILIRGKCYDIRALMQITSSSTSSHLLLLYRDFPETSVEPSAFWLSRFITLLEEKGVRLLVLHTVLTSPTLRATLSTRHITCIEGVVETDLHLLQAKTGCVIYDDLSHLLYDSRTSSPAVGGFGGIRRLFHGGQVVGFQLSSLTSSPTTSRKYFDVRQVLYRSTSRFKAMSYLPLIKRCLKVVAGCGGTLIRVGGCHEGAWTILLRQLADVIEGTTPSSVLLVQHLFQRCADVSRMLYPNALMSLPHLLRCLALSFEQIALTLYRGCRHCTVLSAPPFLPAMFASRTTFSDAQLMTWWRQHLFRHLLLSDPESQCFGIVCQVNPNNRFRLTSTWRDVTSFSFACTAESLFKEGLLAVLQSLLCYVRTEEVIGGERENEEEEVG
eukprot:gene16476-18700_t